MNLRTLAADPALDPGTRHPTDTDEQRVAILLDIIEQFALDRSPKRGLDVFLAAVKRSSLDAEIVGVNVKSAIMLLVKGGLLASDTLDPLTGLVVFELDMVLWGAPILECFMTFVLDDPSNARQVH